MCDDESDRGTTAADSAPKTGSEPDVLYIPWQELVLTALSGRGRSIAWIASKSENIDFTTSVPPRGPATARDRINVGIITLYHWSHCCLPVIF